MSLADKEAGGGRVELRRQEERADAVTYRAELTRGDDAWTFDVDVALEGGAVSFPPDAESAPEFLRDVVRVTLRSLWRAHKTEGFPRRVARWRPQK